MDEKRSSDEQFGKRRFQFGLRSLFVANLLVAVAHRQCMAFCCEWLSGHAMSVARVLQQRGHGERGGASEDCLTTVVIWDSGRNDRTQPRRADDVTRESGTECAIRRWL